MMLCHVKGYHKSIGKGTDTVLHTQKRNIVDIGTSLCKLYYAELGSIVINVATHQLFLSLSSR